MSASFNWLYGDTSEVEMSKLDQRIFYLKRYLANQSIPMPVHRIIREGLAERPLSFEVERYKEFLTLGTAVAWKFGLDHLENQCYQRYTGKSLRRSSRSINHSDIRKHLFQPDEPSAMSLTLRHDWDKFKAWIRRIYTSLTHS
ncbi:MAG: hypothetical protein JWN75_437 [Candidatus Saccharibacteria bacterium]|nr:hypothetical protein [Candidatus Saccharibacteria bacterium]